MTGFKHIRALTFDCYGTLIDWESGIVAALAPLAARAKHPLSRDDILNAHACHESHQQAQTPTMRYADLLAIVYKRLGEEWAVPTTHSEAAAYGQSVKVWPAFPDSADALRRLKAHFQLVILSNVDNASFEGSRARLGVDFDAVFTAEDVGAYKPSDRNFVAMIDGLAGRGIKKGAILHTAESLFHDHVPARRHGLERCWIFRRHDTPGFGATMPPAERPPVDHTFPSMAAFAAAVEDAA
ncbi:MAG: haloacid dehalogenase type II [Pseudomonadota bacterium]